MKKIPKDVIEDWVKNKKRISDRVNRIKKRLKKYTKQLSHYELRLKIIQRHEKETRNQNTVPSQGVSNQSVHQNGEASSEDSKTVSSQKSL